MTEKQEREYEVLDEILSDISAVYEKLEVRRDGISESIANKLDGAASRIYDTELAIRGRLNELNEDYCVRDGRYGSNGRLYSPKFARMAKTAGINYVALERVNYHDREAAMRYIQDNGLASLNYEATCAAVREFEEKRNREYWEKYHAARDLNIQALMLKVLYEELDAVIEYLRANGYAGKDFPLTCDGIEEYYAERRTA